MSAYVIEALSEIGAWPCPQLGLKQLPLDFLVPDIHAIQQNYTIFNRALPFASAVNMQKSSGSLSLF